MRLFPWLTRNWADSDDPANLLQPLVLRQELPRAMIHVQQAVRHLPRWQIESVDEEQQAIHATRRTRLFRFVNDIHIRLTPVGLETRVQARSQSRFGIGDFGQNRRNLVELWEVLELLNQL